MTPKYAIDSSAWIEYLGGTSKGSGIKSTIEEETLCTSIISIAEIADKFERMGWDFAPSLRFIQSRAAIIELNVALSLKAARLKNQVRKDHTKFSLADGIHLATALQEKAILLTADSDFRGLDQVQMI